MLRHCQWRYGCTPESQIVVRHLQGYRCWVCETDNPTCFDVIGVATGDETEQQIVYDYVGQRCKGVVSIVVNNRILFGRARTTA